MFVFFVNLQPRSVSLKINKLIDFFKGSLPIMTYLPEEIWIFIFKKFSLLEQLKLRLVCSTWRQIIEGLKIKVWRFQCVTETTTM